MLFLLAGRLKAGRLGELGQSALPGVGPIQRCAELFVAFSVAFDGAVFEFDERGRWTLGSKSDFNFARMGGVGVEFPGRPKMPGKGDAVGRFPGEDVSPVAVDALSVALIPSASAARLDDDRLEGLRRDVVIGGPPGFHLLDEDGEGALNGSLNADAFVDEGQICGFGHACLPFR